MFYFVILNSVHGIIIATLVLAVGGSLMKKTQNITNTKIKYTEFKNYNKHFTLDDRIRIQKIITEHRDENGNLTIMLKDIGNMLSNDPSTISKEVKLHRVRVSRREYNTLACNNSICKNYNSCTLVAYINDLGIPCYKKKLGNCINNCEVYEELVCQNLKRFPWVCNGCPKVKGCRLNKFFYYSDEAYKEYKQKLISSREGIKLTPDEFKILNHTVSTYVKKGQPIYHIFASNDLPVSERTIYNYFERGYLDAKNIDLRRKVTYKKRYQHKSNNILKKIKQGRTYEDYLDYIKTNPDASIVEMDTVISSGECNKVLLTLHFVKFHFQLAYILNSKEIQSISDCINNLCNQIGIDNFKKIFEVILTDNGPEFSNPESIEFEPDTGELRSKVFYCHPYASREKGHCEKNHEYIRYILPKGTSFEFLTQNKCNLMMSHINSTKRPSVNGSPYDFMALAYGTELLDTLKIKKIESKDVTLSPKLLNNI